MFDQITGKRLVSMTSQETRWLDNIKKAFRDSDSMIAQKYFQDSLEYLFKAIDTAKTLRRSLLGFSPSTHNNKAAFIEFLALEIPAAQTTAKGVRVVDSRSGKVLDMTFGEIVYAIRCMIHENENLNKAENVEYHILLDWTMPEYSMLAELNNGRITCNGRLIWRRLREVLAKFITGMDAMIAFEKGNGCEFTIAPPLLSIKPGENFSTPRR